MRSRYYKYYYLFVLVLGLLFIGSHKVGASNCFTAADSLTGSPINNTFPRQTSNRDASAGCGNTNSAHIFLSTYYSNVNGSPGSTLNTPQASLSIFFIGNPGPSSAVQLDLNVAFCLYGGVSRPVYIFNGNVLVATQTGAGSTSVSLPGSSFSDQSAIYGTIAGQPIYKFNNSITLSVDSNSPRNCEVTTSVSSGLITFDEDNSPTIALGGNGARPNQNTYGRQAGNRSIVPGNVGALANGGYGAFAVRTRATATDAVEYTIPFAPSCTVPVGGETIYLRVYDSDAPNPANPPGTTNGSFNGGDFYPKMEILDYDAAGGFLGTADPTGNANRVVTGNDEYGEYAFVVQPGHKYAWRWWNISAHNGLQVWMPFSEISARPGAACPPTNKPPTGNISLSCVRNAAGFPVINYTVNTNDLDGDSVSIQSGNVGGRAIPAGVNSVSGSFGGGFGEVGNAIASITDNKSPALNIFGVANYVCPINNPPSGPFSASCSTAGLLPVKRQLNISLNFSDPDGGVTLVRVSSNGPPYAGYIVNSNGAFVSPANYPSPALDGNTYTLWFEARDAQSGAWAVVGTVNYFCYPIPAFLTCVITSSASLEPGEQVKPSATVTSINHNLSGSMVYNLKTPLGAQVPGSPQGSGNQVFTAAGTNIGIPPFSAITMPSLGAFKQTGTVTIPAPLPVPDDPTTAPCVGPDVSIGIKPYFRVLGGDIMNTDPASQVQGFNKANLIVNYTGPGAVNDPSGRSGSGTQGLVIDAGKVVGVASGVFTGSALLPKPLTFANYDTVLANIPNSQFGGGFGPLTFTLPVADPAATPWTASSTSNGSFTYNADATYSNGAIPNGTRMTVYITGGNLQINGNIVYAGAGAGYPGLASIPHIKFVVLSGGVAGKGNININGSVSQIDAELVAEGSIDTCYNLALNAYNTCSVAAGASPLVVNGSLAASKVKMGRLVGTLRESRPEDGSRVGPCPAPIANGYCNFNNIAEIIQFTPEVYLSNPAEAPPTPTGNRYDSITALPPLF